MRSKTLKWSTHFFLLVLLLSYNNCSRFGAGGINLSQNSTVPAAVSRMPGVLDVYSGCPAPSSTPTGNVYYSDPINGSMSNDGSQLRPWGSLSSIAIAGKFAPNASAVVKAGDTVYLLDGQHGSMAFQNGYNTGFVYIKAATGHSPVVKNITLYGGSYWYFSGLTIQNLNSGGYVFGARLNGENMVFTGNVVYSQAEVSAWTQEDWRRDALFIAAGGIGNCISVTNNTIYNVKAGVVVGGTNVLVRGNSMHHLGSDGVDYGQGTGAGTLANIEISKNIITDLMDIGNGAHLDGIQGWVLNGTVGENILIDSNQVIAKTDPNLAFPGFVQGINEFDGAWKNMRIVNNVVIASAYHGISVYGVQDVQIINNTVFGNYVASNGDTNQTWIGVFTSGPIPPSNVVIRNNVTNINGLFLPAAGVVADHNVKSDNPASLFQKFDRALFQYDLRPQVGSILYGSGSPTLAPAVDILSIPRGTAITAGAYQ